VPIPRSVTLLTAFLLMICAVPGTAQGADPIDDLRQEAAKARTDLEKATKKFEQRRKDLIKSQAELRDTLQDLAKAEAELFRIREPLAELANMAHQHPAVGGTITMVAGGDPAEALRGAADLGYLAEGQEALIDKADTLQKRRSQLASKAQELQSEHAVEQTKLQQEIDILKEKSAQLTVQLTKMLDKLDVSRERRLELSCDKDLVSGARKFPNGLIPAKYLCGLPQKGEQLRADAALGFYKLNTAYKKRFGRNICVTDSYRNLSNQQRIYYQRPGFAAIPGRSNHGLGTAVDLCGGIQNSGSAQFNWMEAHSRKYGWYHPSWAYSSPFEPWHWEYGKPE
jgi:zinc D-Ala-D-Ala carboxypeptidase